MGAGVHGEVFVIEGPGKPLAAMVDILIAEIRETLEEIRQQEVENREELRLLRRGLVEQQREIEKLKERK